MEINALLQNMMDDTDDSSNHCEEGELEIQDETITIETTVKTERA